MGSCISKKKEKNQPELRCTCNDNVVYREQQHQLLQAEYEVSGEIQKRDQPKNLDHYVSSHSGSKGSSAIRPMHDPMSHPIDFYRERKRCLKEKRIFEDSTFPANDSSLYFSGIPSRRVEWLRSHKITRDPHLFTDGHSRFDVVQGELGDCWMLAAVASLTLEDELFYRVVPRDQSFTTKYAGIFHFQFWQYGEWVDVVIDDRLPTRDGKLLFMHSESHNEFWSALLEKAYAKLHGSYEALAGGLMSEAFEDMTGGLTELFDFKNAPLDLMNMMKKGFKKGSLFDCATNNDPKRKEAVLKNGLVTGHAYSITGMICFKHEGDNVCLLRIRNPWGNGKEWKGAWKDGCSKWRSVSDKLKQQIELKFRDDGEFWMSFNDFLKYFAFMEICYLSPDTLDEFHTMKSCELVWTTTTYHGTWTRHLTDNDPQYRMKLTDADPDDDDELCTVIVAVMQKNRRKMKHRGLDDVAIGFAVYKVPRTRGRVTEKFMEASKPVLRTPMTQTREMTRRFRVPPGEYVIVPFTSSRSTQVEFMLRIFTNGIIDSKEV